MQILGSYALILKVKFKFYLLYIIMNDIIEAITLGCRYEGAYKLLISRIISILKEKRQIEPRELINELKHYGVKTYKQSKIFQHSIKKLKLLGLMVLKRDKNNKKYYVYTPELFYEKFKIAYQLLK